MSTPAVPAPGNPPAPSAGTAGSTGLQRVDPFGDVWPDENVPARPGVVAASSAVGLLAAVVVPERDPGIGFALVAPPLNAEHCAGLYSLSVNLPSPFGSVHGQVRLPFDTGFTEVTRSIPTCWAIAAAVRA